MIANGARKMERQDAPRVPPRLASKSELEVARVLVPPPANLLPVSPSRPLPDSPIDPFRDLGPKPVEDEHVNEPVQVPLDDPGDRRPSLVIMKPFPPIPSDPPGSDFVPSSEPPESPRTPPDLGRSFASTEISSPTPQQDTIHNIVGTDNRDSMLSASSTDQPGSEALTDVEEEDMLAPPGPIFDLTPGREPSPARYRHGEPLQFGEHGLPGHRETI